MTPGQVAFETWLLIEDEALERRRRRSDLAMACRLGFGADPEDLQRFLDDNKG